MSDISNLLSDVLAFGQKPEVKTVYDNLSWMWEPREKIVETPRAGYPDGQDSAATNNTIDKAADVITTGKNFYTQLKGLFGLGYPAVEAQPVSPINHEVTPADLPTPTADGSPIKLGGLDIKIIAIAGIALLLLMKK